MPLATPMGLPLVVVVEPLGGVRADVAQVALLMTLEGLREELAPLDIELGREVEREIHEGPFHGGPSATVQLVGRRR